MRRFAGRDYVVSHGFFRKGEIADLCALLQLQDGSELTTRALAERVMHARELDVLVQTKVCEIGVVAVEVVADRLLEARQRCCRRRAECAWW